MSPPSLKSRMAAFQQAAADDAPATAKISSMPRQKRASAKIAHSGIGNNNKSMPAVAARATAFTKSPTQKQTPAQKPRRLSNAKNANQKKSIVSSSPFANQTSPSSPVPVQNAAVSRRPVNLVPSNKSIASRSSAFSKSKPSSTSTTSTRSAPLPKNNSKKVPVPRSSNSTSKQNSVCSRYSPTKKDVSPTSSAKPKPKPLTASQKSVLEKPPAATTKPVLSSKLSSNKPPLVDATKGGYATPETQTQENISDKAKNAVVAPPKPSSNQQKDCECDWDYLYQLAVNYDQYKLQQVEVAKGMDASTAVSEKEKSPKHQQGDKSNIKNALEGIVGGTNFTANGKFLTNEYLDQYLVENNTNHDNNTAQASLTLDFSGQNKLFKFFNRKNEEQAKIAQHFVEVLLHHPRANNITALNFTNSLLPDCFLQSLADQYEPKSSSLFLPKLQVLNLESNVLGEEGVVALSRCIAGSYWPYLQVIKLDNQKMPLTSDAEEALGEAVLQSPSLVVVSLRARCGLARQQINNTVQQNIDNLRLARTKHAKKNGTFQERRKRNEMEQFFDKIAANSDSTLTEVNLVGNIKFLGLNPTERLKAAASFATNTHVKQITLCQLKLDDTFATALGEALVTNVTLEKVVLDSNAFSGNGLKDLMKALAQNTSITEFQVRHQSKAISSADEELLPALLADNTVLLKLGVDVRTPLARMQLDRKTNENREYQRKQRAATKKK